MRNVVLATVIYSVLVAVATWKHQAQASEPGSGSSAGSGSSTTSQPEPITGDPVIPNPGDETPQKPPFTMYSHGGSNAEIPYAQLSADEKAWADDEPSKGGDWQAINNAYAGASRLRAQEAGASSAAAMLGLTTPLGSTGVVP